MNETKIVSIGKAKYLIQIIDDGDAIITRVSKTCGGWLYNWLVDRGAVDIKHAAFTFPRQSIIDADSIAAAAARRFQYGF